MDDPIRVAVVRMEPGGRSAGWDELWSRLLAIAYEAVSAEGGHHTSHDVGVETGRKRGRATRGRDASPQDIVRG